MVAGGRLTLYNRITNRAGIDDVRVKSAIGSLMAPALKAKYFTFQYVFEFIRTGCTTAPRECNICGYSGSFYPFGHNLRRDAGCPKCRSLERHRLFKLFYDENPQYFYGKDILHFAPEKSLLMFTKTGAKSYLTADLFSQFADVKLNIEQIEMQDQFDTVIASHILEHVDDYKALRSIHDALRPGGVLLAMVPIAENLKTFEDGSITDLKLRELYFGQHDHVRWYGGDFVDRVEAAGLEVKRYVPTEPSIPRYGLIRGETIFCCTRL